MYFKDVFQLNYHRWKSAKLFEDGKQYELQ